MAPAGAICRDRHGRAVEPHSEIEWHSDCAGTIFADEATKQRIMRHVAFAGCWRRVWGRCFLANWWGLRDAAVLRFAALRALIGMMGVVNVTSAFGAMFAGVAGLSTDAASVLANAQPLLILLPGWWFYGGSISLRTAISSAVGFSGSLLVGLSSGGGTGAALSFPAAPGFIASTLRARRLHGSGLLMVSTWQGSSQVPPGCARRLDILSPGCQYCRVKALA